MSSGKRTGSRVSKSFTGCARCKEKKKKCDESSPSCQACVRAGDECPGFVQQLRWSRKHERLEHSRGGSPEISRKKIVRSRPIPKRHSTDHVQLTSVTPRVHDPDDASEVTSSAAVYANDLNVMFSQWLNAEFLPRDDLPLLGLNLPLGQYSTRLTSESMLWPTADDFQLLEESRNPYQGLQIPSEPCDHLPADGTAQNVDSQGNQHGVNAEYRTHDSFLEAFYRMSSPAPYARFSPDHLVKYYFTDVCSIVSCFNSTLNPFRTLAADEITRSKTVSLTVQSMSIAHLSNHYSSMLPLVVAKRCEAWKSLQSDLQRHRTGHVALETVLLSLLLLGTSAPWHQPANLGFPYLFIMRTLMQGYFRVCQSARQQPKLKNESFFADALMYWEKLASFLDPFPMQSLPGNVLPDLPPSSNRRPRLPHPWTGVSTELDFALAELGRILRRRRRHLRTTTELKDAEPCQIYEEQWVVKLEKFLLTFEPPTPDNILDYGDEDTPKSDLIRISHAQRYSGLLEIYHELPHLYEELLASRTSLPLLYDRTIHQPSNTPGNTDTLETSLCNISMEVLDSLKEISVSSSACRLLPMVLVSLAGHLRFPYQPLSGDEVVEARYFVESRMLALTTRYPQRQTLQMLGIVKDVWDRLDNDHPDNAHWMDIMHETQTQTMMG